MLRSKALDAAATPSEVHDRAGPLIAMLNGALAVTHGTRPIGLDYVIEFMSDGTERRHPFATLAGASGRGKAKAVAVALGPDGQPLPPLPPQPSEAQRWLDIAATDDKVADALADALTFFSRGHDWFDIYKAWECLKIRFGKVIARGLGARG